MLLQTFIVNAFVDPEDQSNIGSGNPAGVVLLTEEQDNELSDEDRLKISAQLRYSETAFVVPLGKRGSVHEFSLRWFTPLVEVDLCGHATLASASAIVADGRAKVGEELHFVTQHSGKLVVRGEGSGRLTMEFPCLPAKSLEVNRGGEERLIGQVTKGLTIDREDIEECYESLHDLLVVVKGVDVVEKIQVNRSALMDISTRGVIVGSRVGESDESLKRYGFVSRFFAPRVGIDEDAVTGSAHCVLAKVFMEVDGETVGAKQMSERGGTVMVGRASEESVSLGGWSRVILRGTFEL